MGWWARENKSPIEQFFLCLLLSFFPSLLCVRLTLSLSLSSNHPYHASILSSVGQCRWCLFPSPVPHFCTWLSSVLFLFFLALSFSLIRPSFTCLTHIFDSSTHSLIHSFIHPSILLVSWVRSCLCCCLSRSQVHTHQLATEWRVKRGERERERNSEWEEREREKERFLRVQLLVQKTLGG